MGPNNGPAFQGYYNGYGQPAPKKFLNKTVLIIAGILAVLIIAVVGVINLVNAGDNIETQSAHLSARLTNLTALTEDARKNATTDPIRKINAEVAIITSDAQGQLGSTFPKKLDKKIVAEEADTTSTDKLKAAGLAGTYDAEYKDVLTAKLESVNALLSEIYAKTKSAGDKAKVNAVYQNYTALLARLNAITV